jgi:hypothetical protein
MPAKLFAIPGVHSYTLTLMSLKSVQTCRRPAKLLAALIALLSCSLSEAFLRPRCCCARRMTEGSSNAAPGTARPCRSLSRSGLLATFWSPMSSSAYAAPKILHRPLPSAALHATSLRSCREAADLRLRARLRPLRLPTRRLFWQNPSTPTPSRYPSSPRVIRRTSLTTSPSPLVCVAADLWSPLPEAATAYMSENTLSLKLLLKDKLEWKQFVK